MKRIGPSDDKETMDDQVRAAKRQEAWEKLRGIGKDIYASFGGGEAYLKAERASFYGPPPNPEQPDVEPDVDDNTKL
jgi:hypothetical protein